MISRSASTITTISQRGAAMRRQQRARHDGDRAGAPTLYCRTNGCTSFLITDSLTGTAQCPICGYTNRSH